MTRNRESFPSSFSLLELSTTETRVGSSHSNLRAMTSPGERAALAGSGTASRRSWAARTRPAAARPKSSRSDVRPYAVRRRPLQFEALEFQFAQHAKRPTRERGEYRAQIIDTARAAKRLAWRRFDWSLCELRAEALAPDSGAACCSCSRQRCTTSRAPDRRTSRFSQAARHAPHHDPYA